MGKDKDKPIITIKELDMDKIDPKTDTYQEVDSTGSKIVVIGKPGCFVKGTGVLMYAGNIKNVEDVQIGDIVMGSDCNKREVLDTCYGREMMYSIKYTSELTYKCDNNIIVNKNHILTLADSNKILFDIKLNDFLQYDIDKQKQYKWVKIEPIFHQYTFLNIHPYLIGRIISSNLDKQKIYDEIIAYKTHTEENDKEMFDIIFSGGLSSCFDSNSKISRTIDEISNTTDFKFISNEFLTMSKNCRSSMLRGIIDKIGIIKENIIELTTPNDRLLKDILFLSNSLGYSTGIIEQNILIIYVGKNMPIISQNFNNKEDYTKLIGHMYDFEIIELHEDDYYGFVINKDGRFLLSDCSLVHNTGKCLGKGTEILTYMGDVKKVEDIQVGDLLMGDNSDARKVLSIAQGTDDLFKIEQDFGTSYIVNSDHILSLDKDGEIIDINIKDYISLSDENKKSYKAVRMGFNRDIFSKYKQPKDDKVRNVQNESDDYRFHNDTYNSRCNTTNNIQDETYSSAWLRMSSKLSYFQLILLSGEDERLNFINGFIEYGKEEVINIPLHKDCVGHFTRIVASLGIFCKTLEDGIILYLHDNQLRMDKYTTSTFTISQLDRGEYFGFELDGNGRFLISDLTLTHNTTLINSILYSKKHMIPVALAFSGTEDSNYNYRQMIPSTHVFNALDENIINNFVKRQKIAKKYLINPWSVLLIDDCTDDPKVLSKPLFQNLYKNGRHYKMLFILSLQYSMDIKPVIRTNIDGTFILRETNLSNRKKLWENYASCIPDFNQFCSIMDEITNDYTALYIHNKTQSNNFEDCVFYYKSNVNLGNWRFGCDEFWDFHEDRFDPSYTDSI